MSLIGDRYPKRMVTALGIAILALAEGGSLGGDFEAPTTISEQAREALAQFSREARNQPLPLPGQREQWREVQADVERKRAEANAAVVRRYDPRIEERTVGGVAVLDIKPKGWTETKKVLVYTHGGGYALYSSRSRLMSAVPMAHDTGLRVISIDYTLAPWSQWQATTDQVVAVFRALLEEGRDWKDIAMYGESAGGGLAAGTVLKMRDQGMGMPAAVVLWSPWSDITETGDSYVTLRAADPLLYYPDNLKNCADAYAAPADQKHPYVSPVYGDYSKGFPPTLIQAGTKEILLSNAIRHYQALDQSGIPVKLDLYEGMWHIFQVFNYDLPESRLARRKVRAFLRDHLGGPAADRSRAEAEVISLLDEWMEAFNRLDLGAWEKSFHFPHYRLADGRMEVLKQPGQQDGEEFRTYLEDLGWHHSAWDRRRIVHLSEDKAHVDTRFSRYRNDGSVIGSYESLYVLTRQAARWGVKMRSSFAE